MGLGLGRLYIRQATPDEVSSTAVGYTNLLTADDGDLLGSQAEDVIEWKAECADGEAMRCAAALARLGFFERIMRQKLIALAKGASGIFFRAADTALDFRAAWKFYVLGHHWWAAFTCLFIFSAPAAQYIAARVWLREGHPSRFLIPGSAAHLSDEVTQLRFLMRLPQIAVYQGVHVLVGSASRNEVLAAIECGVESFPQAVVQSRAYWVLGTSDTLSLVSIAGSYLGVATGIYFGLKAFRRREKGQLRQFWWHTGTNMDVSLNRGSVAALHGIKLDPSTVAACLWLSQFQCIDTWYLGNSGLPETIITRLAVLNPVMKAIDVTECKNIGDEGLKAIANGCPKLTTATFDGCENIGDEGLKAIANGCPKLTTASFDGCGNIGDEGLKAIANGCPLLTAARFSGCGNIGDEGLKAIANGCPLLTTASFDGCSKISGEALEVLNEGLARVNVG